MGNTGVGKSSLLNALLGEASILPTSGSRGCTAAVVELVYNETLLDGMDQQARRRSKQVPVYWGEVEFMREQDWWEELEILLGEV